jgi:hypothetical protein
MVEVEPVPPLDRAENGMPTIRAVMVATPGG